MPALLIIREQKYLMRDLSGNLIKLSDDLKKNNGLIVTNNHKYLKDVLKKYMKKKNSNYCSPPR